MGISHTDPAPTLEDIWRLFQETDRKFKETDLKFQETDRQFKETALQFKETDLKFQETDLKFQETDRQFKETDRFIKALSKETNQKIGKLSNRLGEFVEGLIKPSVVKLFRERGIDVHKLYSDVSAENSDLNLATQIDLLIVNGDVCVLIEVKSNLSIDDVNEHIERMGKFKPLFLEYADKKVLGAVAGMVISDNVAKYAYKKGFFVIGQQGETASILNDNKFTPTIW